MALIKITDEQWKTLNDMKKVSESFSDVLKRLIETKRNEIENKHKI